VAAVATPLLTSVLNSSPVVTTNRNQPQVQPVPITVAVTAIITTMIFHFRSKRVIQKAPFSGLFLWTGKLQTKCLI
jgi:hypothetical protein